MLDKIRKTPDVDRATNNSFAKPAGSILALLAFATCLNAAEYDPATADAEVLDAKIVMKALFTDIVATDTGAIAVGERGHILKSSDMKTWVQLPVPTRSVLTNVYARGANLWAVGHEDIILHSSDSGSTWTRQNVDVQATGPLLDVLFTDDTTGMAIGSEGKMLRTTDAGATWTADNITAHLTNKPTAVVVDEEIDDSVASDDIGVDETPPHLNAITRSNKGLMIVGETGAVFTSVDLGANWTKIAFDYNGPFFGALTLSDDSILIYGLNGHAYVTSDLGVSWQRLETGTEATLLGGIAVKGGRSVLVGSRGAFLTKAPDSNVMKSFVFSDGGVIGGVLQQGDSDFVVVGENGILSYSPK
jgi:photosystem II stability/assembly factor-like uncharacterized protein